MAKIFSGVDYQGYADEVKPTEAKEGETYLEIDTLKVFTWHLGKWCELGAPRS